MEKRRALFATPIFSRVEDSAYDNLERNDWLVSVSVQLANTS
jgi:asparagine synthetase A